MEFHLPIIFFMLSIISFGSYADQTASLKVYWKKMLPDTPMPKAITNCLHPELVVNKGGVHLDAQLVDQYPSYYASAPTETVYNNNPTFALFFIQMKDLKPGTKKTLLFPRSSGSESAFLLRHTAASIPFSTAEFSTILGHFAVAPESNVASFMKQTIEKCEEKNAHEEKFCATSLESMVDFAASRLGRRVTAVSTDSTSSDGKRKEFTVTAVREVESHGGGLVACHKERYPYAVFYCHKTKRPVAYTVELKAEGEGEVVEAMAVCHKDTSAWNHEHFAFKVLKVKPGVPVCHFLTEGNLIWVRN